MRAVYGLIRLFRRWKNAAPKGFALGKRLSPGAWVALCLAAVVVCILAFAGSGLPLFLFRYWPDGVPLPTPQGIMVFVPESDPGKQYRLNDVRFYPDIPQWVTPENLEEDYGIPCGEYTFKRFTLQVEAVRLVDRMTRQGWAAESIVLARVDQVYIDYSASPLREGESVLLYCGDRKDIRRYEHDGHSDRSYCYPVPVDRAVAEPGNVWEVRVYTHDTMPSILRGDDAGIDEKYQGYDYWSPAMTRVSDYFLLPCAGYRGLGTLKSEQDQYPSWADYFEDKAKGYEQVESLWRDARR